MKKYYLNQKTKLLALSIFFTVAFASFTARAQYCSTGLGGGACGAGNLITAVEIVGTSLNSAGVTCTTQPDGGALTIVPPVGSATTTLTQGQTYSFSVTTDGSHIISIWIDYDNNQTYDPTEWTQVCTTSATGVANTVSITIPYAPFTGTTGMRVRSRANGNQNDAVAACIQFGSGEAMDYTITIAAGSPCVAPPTAGATVSSVPTACLGTLNTLALNGNSIGAGQTYQWQSSPDNITWTNINGATNQSYNDSVIAAFYFRCELTCSGIVANSTSVFVGLNPAKSVLLCFCGQSNRG